MERGEGGEGGVVIQRHNPTVNAHWFLYLFQRLVTPTQYLPLLILIILPQTPPHLPWLSAQPGTSDVGLPWWWACRLSGDRVCRGILWTRWRTPRRQRTCPRGTRCRTLSLVTPWRRLQGVGRWIRLISGLAHSFRASWKHGKIFHSSRNVLNVLNVLNAFGYVFKSYF